MAEQLKGPELDPRHMVAHHLLSQEIQRPLLVSQGMNEQYAQTFM